MRIEDAARLGMLTPEEVALLRAENPCQGFELVPADQLMHVVTDTSEARARALLRDWNISLLSPIRMKRGDGGRLILTDGDHRLRTMRALGYRQIPAIVAEGRA